MKRVNLFLIAAVVAASAVFVSCNTDPSDEPTITIRFNEGAASTDGKFEAFEGETVKVEVEFKAPGKIKEVRIQRTGSSGTLPDGYPKTSGFTAETLHQDSWTVSLATKGTVQYTVDVTDKDKEPQRANRVIEITFIERPPQHGEINKFPASGDLVIGSLAHTGSANSACASATGTTFAVVGISAADQAKVDFIYFDGTAANNRDKSLAAPNNSSVGSLSGVSGWTTKNPTKLGLLSGVTAAQFDDCTNDALITEKVTTTAVNADIVSQLQAGNVIGFITAGGKKGLIKVVSIDQSSAANNSIKVVIKVQK